MIFNEKMSTSSIRIQLRTDKLSDIVLNEIKELPFNKFSLLSQILAIQKHDREIVVRNDFEGFIVIIVVFDKQPFSQGYHTSPVKSFTGIDSDFNLKIYNKHGHGGHFEAPSNLKDELNEFFIGEIILGQPLVPDKPHYSVLKNNQDHLSDFDKTHELVLTDLPYYYQKIFSSSEVYTIDELLEIIKFHQSGIDISKNYYMPPGFIYLDLKDVQESISWGSIYKVPGIEVVVLTQKAHSCPITFYKGSLRNAMGIRSVRMQFVKLKNLLYLRKLPSKYVDYLCNIVDIQLLNRLI